MLARVQRGAVTKLGAAAVLVAAMVLLGGRGPGLEGPAADRSALIGDTLPNDMVARGKHGVVVTQEPHATAVGLEVLRQGGNAVDAAVAVALTLAVTLPQAGNLGGGGFMVLRGPDGQVSTIDFRERAPKSATRDMYLKPDGSVDNDKVQLSVTAAGVPGSPAGLHYALQKFGTKNLSDVAKPAIQLAQEGFASSRAVFFDGDAPRKQGDLLVQSDLAGTLQRFADQGLKGFYEGETADFIAADMQAGGGFVTRDDLKAYEPRERDALRVNYRGYEVISMGPPSSGGVAMLQMLNLLSPLADRGHAPRLCRPFAVAWRPRLLQGADGWADLGGIRQAARRFDRPQQGQRGRARFASWCQGKRRYDAFLDHRQGWLRGFLHDDDQFDVRFMLAV